MKPFPVHFLLWYSLLVLWILQSGTKGNSSDFCQEESQTDLIHVQTATGNENVDKNDVKEAFVCLLYPSNELNCSWSFHTLEKDSQLSVHISVCNGDVEVLALKEESVERDASATLDITEFEMSSVVLHFNMSLHDEWTAYTAVFDEYSLDLLFPSPHINASVKDKDLIITWDLPRSRFTYNPRCFVYQLDMGDQNEHKTIEGHQSYKEPNVDPTHTYRLRMRARISNNCDGYTEWSNWSHAVVVDRSLYTLHPLVVIFLTLGIPLSLAVLLFLRHRRLLDVLFPPIPHPPPKYKYFLEKGDTFNFFYPAVPAKPEEEITEVEDRDTPSEEDQTDLK